LLQIDVDTRDLALGVELENQRLWNFGRNTRELYELAESDERGTPLEPVDCRDLDVVVPESGITPERKAMYSARPSTTSR
jgi:hypothetical protein